VLIALKFFPRGANIVESIFFCTKMTYFIVHWLRRGSMVS
jgi:hypothetical protein